MASATEPLVDGARLGPFVLEGCVERRSHVEIWLARRAREDARPVVLEILDVDDPDEEDRFVRGVQAVAPLRHPNLIRVYGTHRATGRVFAAVERVPGSSAEALFARARPLAAEAAGALARDLFRGLGYAHRHGRIHGRLDLGCLRVGHDGAARLGGFGWPIGIARPGRHAAPEVRSGRSPSVRSDLFSAASLALTLFSGRADRRADLSPFAAPAEVRSLLARMLEQDPGARPASLDAMERALERWLGVEGGRAALALLVDGVPSPSADVSDFPTLSESHHPAALDDPTDPQRIPVGSEHTVPGIRLDEAETLEPAFPEALAPLDDELEVGESTLADLEIPSHAPLPNPGPWVAAGVRPSPMLPLFETATEIDERSRATPEDPTTVRVLEGFASDASPSDPLGRFEALRAPSESEIDAAIQAVPTLAFAPSSVWAPPDSRRSPSVARPRDAELRRIVERSGAADPALPLALSNGRRTKAVGVLSGSPPGRVSSNEGDPVQERAQGRAEGPPHGPSSLDPAFDVSRAGARSIPAAWVQGARSEVSLELTPEGRRSPEPTRRHISELRVLGGLASLLAVVAFVLLMLLLFR